MAQWSRRSWLQGSRPRRHLLRPCALERESQQVTQSTDHAIGGFDLALLHERRDGVQRVEQEVRLQLHAQHLELRLREPRFEL